MGGLLVVGVLRCFGGFVGGGGLRVFVGGGGWRRVENSLVAEI